MKITGIDFKTPVSRWDVVFESFQEVETVWLFDSLSDLDVFWDVSEVSERIEGELSSWDTSESDILDQFTIWSALVTFGWNDSAQSVNASDNVGKSIQFCNIWSSVSSGNNI